MHDYYLQLTLRDLGPGGRVRLDMRGSYTGRSTLKFYGLGNAAPEPPPTFSNYDREYGRNYPEAWVRARVRLRADFELHAGSVFWYDWVNVHPDSLLAIEAASGPPDVTIDHRPPGCSRGAAVRARLDLRQPRQRDRHAARRLSHVDRALQPGAGRAGCRTPTSRSNASTRFYATLVPRWLIVSWRLVGDVLLGQPPFYELARFEEVSAIGGAKGVRGVPAERYYGKVKLFQNLEARSEVVRFHIKGKPYTLAGAAFFDAGRVWTELGRAHPELDGTGIGLKYGVGGGLRLHQGETFVVRGDVAWSPDAKPIAGYFAAGQIL